MGEGTMRASWSELLILQRRIPTEMATSRPRRAQGIRVLF